MKTGGGGRVDGGRTALRRKWRIEVSCESNSFEGKEPLAADRAELGPQ